MSASSSPSSDTEQRLRAQCTGALGTTRADQRTDGTTVLQFLALICWPLVQVTFPLCYSVFQPGNRSQFIFYPVFSVSGHHLTTLHFALL